MKTISTINELLRLEFDFKHLELKNNSDDSGNPKKGEEFVLWRGAKDATYKLMSSLQLKLEEKYRYDWKSKIKDTEKNLLNKFLSEIEPHKNELNNQYHWFKQMPGNQDTVWILSVMQHYGLPTRFVDFTSCFWSAVFFASDGVKGNTDMILYSLKCKNEDNKDSGGNKLPRDSGGNPWKNKNDKVDINDFLGNMIGYGNFAKNSKDLRAWDSPTQPFGWDRPAMQNARVKKQNGFFVYPVDITKTLEEILNIDNTLTKYKIENKLLPEIRKKLSEKNMNSWIMYLDLERAFNKFKESFI